MKIGLIKETKVPVDNRVALSPQQVAKLNQKYIEHKIVVQASDSRAFCDEEYISAGVDVVSDLSDCDILIGIKEARIETLIPNKHYIFFGHIAKMQEYNRPLIQAMIQKNLTFSDYEYMVDDNNQRLCAFGWWAGVVGVYYTLRGYGLRTKLYVLPKPDINFTLNKLLDNLKAIDLPPIKIIITGAGRVSQGAQYVLESIGASKLDGNDFLSADYVDKLSYTVEDVDKLVRRKDSAKFSFQDFIENADEYESDFMKWAYSADILLCAHYWNPNAPVYLTEENLRDPHLRIKMIGDVSCDIMGSVKSTVRPSTHDEPYYDYNPITCNAEAPFSSISNISVMAVDTCPNALPRDTSVFFGEMLIKHMLEPLLQGVDSDVISRATIIKNGMLTKRFSYLSHFALD